MEHCGQLFLENGCISDKCPHLYVCSSQLHLTSIICCKLKMSSLLRVKVFIKPRIFSQPYSFVNTYLHHNHNKLLAVNDRSHPRFSERIELM